MAATDGTSDAGEWPSRPPAPTLTVAAVARRLGVAPPTLRTWDRRYGLGPSAHTAGAHRRYSPSDVARLMVMRRLTLEGVPPADAARYALAASDSPEHVALASIIPIGDRLPLQRDRIESVEPAPGDSEVNASDVTAEESGIHPSRLPPGMIDLPPDLDAEDTVDPFAETDLRALRRADSAEQGEGIQAEDPRALDGPWRDEPGEEIETPWLGVLRAGKAEERGRFGSARVVPLPSGTPATRGLARAAMSLDTHRTARLLREGIRRSGVVPTWDDVILPVMQALGERTGATGDGIDVEHAFSEVLIGVFREISGYVRATRRSAPVVLACAEEDYHSMPLHVLAAALAERDVACTMLGTGLPAHALAAAVRRIGPCAVVLYAQMPGAHAGVVEDLRRLLPTPRVILGGPGWLPLTVPASARTASSLGEAIDEVRQCLPA